MIALGQIVDVTDLWHTVAASIVAGVGVTVIFTIAIWGATRFVDLSRDGRSAAATGAAILAGLALVVTIASVVVGIVVMTTK